MLAADRSATMCSAATLGIMPSSRDPDGCSEQTSPPGLIQKERGTHDPSKVRVAVRCSLDSGNSRRTSGNIVRFGFGPPVIGSGSRLAGRPRRARVRNANRSDHRQIQDTGLDGRNDRPSECAGDAASERCSRRSADVCARDVRGRVCAGAAVAHAAGGGAGDGRPDERAARSRIRRAGRHHAAHADAE